MTRFFVFFTLILFSVSKSYAQVDFGIMGGIQSIEVANTPLVVSNNESVNDFLFGAQNSDIGIHFGAFMRLKYKSIFLQPEVVFNSTKVNYKWQNLNDKNQAVSYLKESYQYLDIPIKLGIKKGLFVFHTGPIGHYFINSTSELWQIKDYDQKIENFKWSWELGAGIEFLFLKFDIHYERDMTGFGDYVELFGEKYQFDKSAAKWVASAYLSF